MQEYIGKKYKVNSAEDSFYGAEFTVVAIVNAGILLECAPANTDITGGAPLFRAFPGWIDGCCTEITPEAMHTPNACICSCDIVQVWNKGHNLNCPEIES